MTISDAQHRREDIDRMPEAVRAPFVTNLQADVLQSIADGCCESPHQCAAIVMGMAAPMATALD